MRFRWVVMLMILMPWASVNAGVYKWVDDQGQVHFGDNPQSADKSERLKLPESPAADPSAIKRLEDQKRYLDARGQERATTREEQEKLAKEQAANGEFCEKSKARLAMLERGGRLYSEGANGERVYLSDADRAVEIEKEKMGLKGRCE